MNFDLFLFLYPASALFFQVGLILVGEIRGILEEDGGGAVGFCQIIAVSHMALVACELVVLE